MSKKSVRVQLYPEDQEKLAGIAAQHGCLYNGEGNISLLLTKIAQEKLIIADYIQDIKEDKRIPSVPLIGLEIEVPCDLNGIISLVAERIGALDGNIYDIKAKNVDPLIHISLSMPKDSNLNALIYTLKGIKVKDVIPFNQMKKLENLLKVLSPEKKQWYILLKRKENSHYLTKNLLPDLLSEFYDQSLITDIILTLGFRIEIRNTPGALAKLTHEIAQKYISILEIDQHVDAKEEINIARFLLGFYPQSNDRPLQEIENIQDFVKKLKRLDFIEDVHQVSVY